MRITRPLAVTLAICCAALAAPAAHAQQTDPAQADLHASVALAAAAARQQQDLRGTDASSRQSERTLVAGAKPAAPATPTDDGGTANGLGAVAGLVVIGLAYLYMRRGRRAAF